PRYAKKAKTRMNAITSQRPGTYRFFRTEIGSPKRIRSSLPDACDNWHRKVSDACGTITAPALSASLACDHHEAAIPRAPPHCGRSSNGRALRAANDRGPRRYDDQAGCE